MRKTIYLAVLLAAITGSAYAGEIPQPGSSASETVVQGEMGQPLTDIMTTLLETVLSLI